MTAFVHIIRSLALAATILVNAGLAIAAEKAPGEYEVKAAFVYNFFTFVEWPPQTIAQADAIKVCLLGKLPNRDAFDELNGQDAMGKKLTVIRITSQADAGKCQILFIGPSEERELPRIVKSLQGTGTLTIGDTAGFARQGVVINFYLEDRKVRFEINTAAARRAGLTISSKLLKLAGAVYGGSQAGD